MTRAAKTAKDDEAVAADDALHPRRAADLLGHGEVIAAIDPAASSRAHQSFIFSGVRGIGKATAAYALARRIFDDADAPLIAAASHPDLLAIEPAQDKATKTISVEQIRGMTRFLAHSPKRGAWRMVIVDALDAVNFSGANAMLKTLEEPPPQSLIVLISHRMRPILPTIRSRCRMVRLEPLSHEDTASRIAAMFPEADSGWRDKAAILAGGAPGSARLFAESGAPDLYDATCKIIADGAPSLAALEDTASAWGRGGAGNLAARQSAVLAFDRLLTLAIREAVGNDSVPQMENETRAIAAMLARHDAAALSEMHAKLIRDCFEAETLNTDQGIIFFNFIYALAQDAAAGRAA